ncbi:MAG: hypothetical protein WC529_01825 [Candidatus Margulisiibacteriota bacterium]
MRKSGWAWLLLLLTVTIINYPNPFDPQAGEFVTFECAATASLETSLLIYDLSARLIARKPFPLAPTSYNRTTWNGYSDGNELAGPGVYLYRLVATATNKSIGKGKVWIINR